MTDAALEQRLRGGIEVVDTCSDQRLQRVRDSTGRAVARAALDAACGSSPRRRAGFPRRDRARPAATTPAARPQHLRAGSGAARRAPRSRPPRAARARSPSSGRARRPSRGVRRAARGARGRGSGSARAPSRRCARSGRAAAPRPSGCPRRGGRAAERRRCPASPRARPRRSPAGCARPRAPPSGPRRGPRTSATASSAQHSRSFSNASSSGSSSEMPAAAFTISPSGQYVTPSPYGSARPMRTLARSTPSRNSRASRLFPTPASP